MCEILLHPNFAQIDLEITLKLRVDLQSGLAEDYRLPERFRNLVLKRGTHWHPYITKFIGTNIPGLRRTFGPNGSTSAKLFHDLYPSWKFVSENLGKNPDKQWTENEHDLLNAAVDWLHTKEGFQMKWTFINPLTYL